MIDESSYGTGEFTIHLKSSDWTAYCAPNEASIYAKSAFLHEYIHYLQDTCTYYGSVYRKQIYNHKVDQDVRGGNGDELFDLLQFGNIDVGDIRPTFTVNGKTITLGSLALKESMAQEAQGLVFGEKTTASSQSVYYRGVTKIIDTFLPDTQEIPFLRFCIEDSCLMTEDPAQSLLELIACLAKQEDLRTKVDGENAEKTIKLLYELIETHLSSLGFFKYESIESLGIDSPEFYLMNMECMSRGLFNTEESFFAEHGRFEQIAKIIDNQRIANLRKRQEDHAILAKTLSRFKETKEFQNLFKVFGMPMINSTDANGNFVTNKDDF